MVKIDFPCDVFDRNWTCEVEMTEYDVYEILDGWILAMSERDPNGLCWGPTMVGWSQEADWRHFELLLGCLLLLITSLRLGTTLED